MCATEIEAFVSHLVIAGKVSASIRNPAKSAPRFLYRQVLKIDELAEGRRVGALGQAFAGGADGGAGFES
ncbi:MAG: hypothetical protein ACSLFL_03045 [Alphaproteobacteria bacterium]